MKVFPWNLFLIPFFSEYIPEHAILPSPRRDSNHASPHENKRDYYGTRNCKVKEGTRSVNGPASSHDHWETHLRNKTYPEILEVQLLESSRDYISNISDLKKKLFNVYNYMFILELIFITSYTINFKFSLLQTVLKVNEKLFYILIKY